MLFTTWRLALAGGVPRFSRDLLRTIDRRRFDVVVATVRPAYPEDALDELLPETELHTFDLVGRPSLADHIRIARQFGQLVRRVDPDVVHLQEGVAWLGSGGLLPLRRNPPTLLQIHDAPQAGTSRLRGHALHRLLIARGSRVVVDCDTIAGQLSSAYRVKRSKITVAPLGVDVDAFARPDAGRTKGNARLRVLYVARLVTVKNIPLFVGTAKRVLDQGGDAEFTLVGSGHLLAETRARVESLGLGDRVRVPGHVRDLAGEYRRADVFLSTSNDEGFGLAVVEAMAAGLPVVATAVGGVAESIEQGVSGILCGRGDEEALAGAILGLLDDPNERRRLGHAAEERARREYSLPAMAGRYERLYEQMAARRTARTT